MSAAADAAALEAAIGEIDPDAVDGEPRRRAQQIALGMTLVPSAGVLAGVIARTLAACAKREVEPHAAVWRLRSAALTLRQECERGAPSTLAIDGACHDLVTLFPPAATSTPPPTAEELELVPPADLVRRRL